MKTESLRKLSTVSTAQPPIPEDVPDTHAPFDDSTLKQPLDKNTLPMLRAALEARKLDASGLKAVLVARLSAALGAEEGNGERAMAERAAMQAVEAVAAMAARPRAMGSQVPHFSGHCRKAPYPCCVTR